MIGGLDDEQDDADPNARRLVALYDFDPSTIDWPYRRQKPLPLVTGQVIEIIHDDGSEWALAHPVGQPEMKGYFPKNYTVSVAEYHEMMRDFESGGEPTPQEQFAATDSGSAELLTSQAGGVRGAPPPTSAIPSGALPEPTTEVARPLAFDEDMEVEDPELVIPGLAKYPVLEPQPPLATTFELTKSRMLREMPLVPEPTPEGPSPPEDDLAAARVELERELAGMRQDSQHVPGGQISTSRASTPATQSVTRPEHDFLRRHLPMEYQQKYLKKVSPLTDLVRRTVKVAWEEKQPYPADMRARFTTRRIAAGIEPGIMRVALQRSSTGGAKWTQMFRPGFNDIVNESFKVGCNACILSNLYLNDKAAREQFQKLHTRDVSGTLWFELQRRKEHLFYMRMDFVDVMMCHPEAWSFPDTTRVVNANHGEPINPFHGWFAQGAIDTDKEMEDVEFLYTLRMRQFPEQVFQALALGKIPEWIQAATSLHAEAEREETGDEAKDGPGHGKAIDTENNLMLEAGLDDSEDLYVKVDHLKLARERTQAPDVLDVKMSSFHLKGVNAMRIFLRSRGNPDNMKQPLLTPKQVKDMAFQLGIKGDAVRYWYAMFALRYPLAPEWESFVKDDTRWYLHLPSDKVQPVHPLIKRFREHLDDCMKNEFLWDYRGFVKMKCSDCGIPDSVIWCQQCTDYFCASCFLNSHKTRRGRKHWPMPVPGTRYLTNSEAGRLQDHVPLLNVGFSNRRRFLARDNQSDKNGSRNGDNWLFFHADTFQAALTQAPEKHWYLKRLNPPRLSPGTEGYYYNFASDVIADDATHIMTKAHEQKAISLLQKNIRGAITRRQIRRETEATLVIQKCRQMWEVQRLHGSNGKNAALLKAWYRKYKAKQDKQKLELRVTRLQSIWRGLLVRAEFRRMVSTCTRFQASFRRLLAKRRHAVLRRASICIQAAYRAHHYGRLRLNEEHSAAARIQAVARGVAQRALMQRWARAATVLQAHARGMLTRKRMRSMHSAGLMLQRNWRRFQAQLDLKLKLYERLEEIRSQRVEILHGKLQDAAATLIQCTFRRHRDYQLTVQLKREKGEADKRTATMLVALYSSAASLRNYIHPWWRHLPTEIQEVLQQIKGSLQRTVALVPVTGKLPNEELGRRGLRVAGANNLTYNQEGVDPDLASHMLLSVTRHLLSHVPADVFAATVKWACYTLGHQAIRLNSMPGVFNKEEVVVGKEMPPHPGDSLSTLWSDWATIKHHHDWLISLSDESMPALILHNLPPNHRNVFLTAEVLVTMRQALDSPSISTEDHLRFQGLDASAGAQLMEVLGAELDHRLPLDWPKSYGTVAALAAQMSSHMIELEPDKKDAHEEVAESVSGKKTKKAKQSTKLTKQSQKSAEGGEKHKTKARSKADKAEEVLSSHSATPVAPTSESALTYFNRSATMRLLQQVGYLMRDQDRLMDAVLARIDEANTGSMLKGQGIRQSRYIAVTDKLFEMADQATHDHCSFVLAVVLFHMVLRGLLLRVLYHRAAITIQKSFKYFKKRGAERRATGPAICIQRHWRGFRDALMIMRWDNAASKIQHSYRAWRWNRRAVIFLACVLKAQRVWHGAVQRKWLRELNKAATKIQRVTRGVLVRVALDKAGREIMRKHQQEMYALLQQRSSLSESTYLARCSVVAAKLRVALHKNRERNIDVRRMSCASLRYRQTRQLDKQRKLKSKGSVQPERESIFEPIIFALKRADVKTSRPVYGVQQSRVLLQLGTARRALDRNLPKEESSTPHAAAKRGRAAMAVRRSKKHSKTVAGDLIDEGMFRKWVDMHLAVKPVKQ